MPWWFGYLVAFGVLMLGGIVAIIVGIRKKNWATWARALFIILGFGVAFRSFLEILNVLGSMTCPPSGCP